MCSLAVDVPPLVKCVVHTLFILLTCSSFYSTYKSFIQYELSKYHVLGTEDNLKSCCTIFIKSLVSVTAYIKLPKGYLVWPVI